MPRSSETGNRRLEAGEAVSRIGVREWNIRYADRVSEATLGKGFLASAF
jgi:hypothetical protein